MGGSAKKKIATLALRSDGRPGNTKPGPNDRPNPNRQGAPATRARKQGMPLPNRFRIIRRHLFRKQITGHDQPGAIQMARATSAGRQPRGMQDRTTKNMRLKQQITRLISQQQNSQSDQNQHNKLHGKRRSREAIRADPRPGAKPVTPTKPQQGAEIRRDKKPMPNG